jgi:hypothetical protein
LLHGTEDFGGLRGAERLVALHLLRVSGAEGVSARAGESAAASTVGEAATGFGFSSHGLPPEEFLVCPPLFL